MGLLALFYLGRMWTRTPRATSTSVGPGAMAATETDLVRPAGQAALRVGMSIAAGIGLHNFSEGLAIGQAAHSGEISLAMLLIVGFALHNANEGFGIVGPLGAASVRPSWRWLGLAGLIGGGPTFLGTIVGTSFDSVFVYVGCLALAAGAILYVIGEILPVGRRLSWEITLWGLLGGVLFGVGTDLVVAVAGGQARNDARSRPLDVDLPAGRAAGTQPVWGAQQRVAELEQRISSAGAAGVQLGPEPTEPREGKGICMAA